ncbi:protein root UVB sensitive 3-like isoform X2 [Durio zibethinus]|uniref:Protein root UVB sensitive 3-like isoform X2 n=1 Tax=Durio zibethinus TaxID=66656 RepID=A0A6P5XGN7_DURZI|nr:protein root UVB sensitive 3-like isoform X2 [Durio zibethinus]XP_022727026.1 protein root UVB sensitive 3-like isoform X2 [Durio zibethinus]
MHLSPRFPRQCDCILCPFSSMGLFAGMLMDLLSPLFPSAFIFIVCLGSLSRSFTGVASGATRAALTQHFALQNIQQIYLPRKEAKRQWQQ